MTGTATEKASDARKRRELQRQRDMEAVSTIDRSDIRTMMTRTLTRIAKLEDNRFDGREFGKAMGQAVKDVLTPMLERIKTLETRTASLEGENETLLALLTEAEAKRAQAEVIKPDGAAGGLRAVA